jgi:DNA-binding NtrC family response regulator
VCSSDLFIEDKKIRRLGGSKEIDLNFRLISATNRELEKAMQLGEFRTDLFHRLNLINVHVPPLRERKDDILPLAEFFLQRFSRKHGKQIRKFTEKACRILLDYCWPGNVRELANMVERCCILENSNVIDGSQISDYLLAVPSASKNYLPESEIGESNLSFEQMLSNYKLQILTTALDKCNQNKAQAAKLLQMDRATFRYQLKSIGLE